MRTIHCLNAISKFGLGFLTEDYKLTDEIKEAQGILVRSASLHDMEFSDSLLAVARAGAGVNNIPLEDCAKSGIVVFNTPGANANGVKELVLAGLLLASRDIIGGIGWCRDNKDDENISKTVEKSKKAFAGGEIKGKKLGVIGLGAIGAEVANAAAVLGMEVYGYDPYISVNAAWMLSRDVKHITSVDTIYQECDFISVHVPLLDSTRGMINQETFAKMKDGVVVLNFARDLLVNDDDMAEALASGKVKKYISDFPNPKVVKMPGAIVIPHLGASTEESEDNCAKMAVMELMDYLENGNIRNSVNYPACDLGVKKSVCRVAVFGKGGENVLGQVSAALSELGVSIQAIAGNSKGGLSYTLADVDKTLCDGCVEKLRQVDGVFQVRVM